MAAHHYRRRAIRRLSFLCRRRLLWRQRRGVLDGKVEPTRCCIRLDLLFDRRGLCRWFTFRRDRHGLSHGPRLFPAAPVLYAHALGSNIDCGLLQGAKRVLWTAVPSWRGILLVLAAPVTFGLTVSKLGLAPAIVLSAILSVYASRRSNIWLAGALALGLTLFCLGVFSYGLRLPLPLFGPWLRF